MWCWWCGEEVLDTSVDAEEKRQGGERNKKQMVISLPHAPGDRTTPGRTRERAGEKTHEAG